MRCYAVYCVALILALLPLVARAQDLPPALVLTLHDGRGQPVAGIAARVTDRSGDQFIGQATTDASGTALLALISLDQVRIQVSGSLVSGVPLRLPDTDPQGFLVFLDAGTTQIDLLVDDWGELALDPVTMWVQEGATAPLPPAPTPASLPVLGLSNAPGVTIQEDDGLAVVPTVSAWSRAAAVTTPMGENTNETPWVLLGFLAVVICTASYGLYRYGRAE